MKAPVVKDLRAKRRLSWAHRLLALLAGVPVLLSGQRAVAQLPSAGRGDLASGQDDSGPRRVARPSDAFALSGDVRLDNTVGLGTFVPGEARRVSDDLGVLLRAALTLGHGVGLTALQTVSKNLATNVDSGAARLYDTVVGDTLLVANWSPVRGDEAGRPLPLLLPGGLKVTASLALALPTSRASRFQTRLFALTPGFSVLKPDWLGGRLTVVYAFGFTKNFNRLTTTAVDASNFPTLARPDGPELISGQSEIATGALNTSFAVRNTFAVAWMPTPRLAVGLTYALYNNFKYNDFSNDVWTSANAKPGNGRADLQWGLVSVGYSLDPDQQWTLTALAVTASPPWSADNRTLRFPFFDWRSSADNYTSLGLAVNRAF